MENIVFKAKWQSFFAELGLKSFEDFFELTGGERINKNNKRDVQILTLGKGDSSGVFFMKRFFKPHFKDMFFTWRNFGGFCSQARCEWKNTNFLLENHIGTYRPVCYGEQTKLGLEWKSFFITEQLQSKPMTEFVAENWSQLGAEKKQEIIILLAKTIRRVHDAGISLPDLYLWHIFIKQDETTGQWEFDIIDLHRMQHNVTNCNQQLANLGRLDHSMTDKYFDNSMRELLIESYAGSGRPENTAELARKIRKFSAKVSAKRNPKPY